MVPSNDTASQENQLLDVIIPLDDRFNCRVELTRYQVGSEIVLFYVYVLCPMS